MLSINYIIHLLVAEMLHDSGYSVPLDPTLEPSTRALISTAAKYGVKVQVKTILSGSHPASLASFACLESPDCYKHFKSLYKPRPPVAESWFDGEVKGVRRVDQPLPTNGSHMGIVTSSNTSVSASSRLSAWFKVVENDWGFRPNQEEVRFFRIW